MTLEGSGERIEILLCTRNSADYLAEMLASLAAQTHDDFHLVVSDDCSSDATVAMVVAAQAGFRHPIQITRREKPSGGAREHFNAQLLACRADYAFLADHDDIWGPDKVLCGLDRIRTNEASYGADTPVLVHGDLSVIDRQGRQTTPSFWTFKAIDPAFGTQIQTALMHASVVGCTAVVNKALLSLVRTMPSEAVMHDWWINLIAATFGVVDYDPEARIQYRVHGRNTSMPKRTTFGRALSRWDNVKQGRRWIKCRLEQGEAFFAEYGREAPVETYDKLATFAAISHSGPVRRRWLLLQGGFRSPGRWRNIAAIVLV